MTQPFYALLGILIVTSSHGATITGYLNPTQGTNKAVAVSISPRTTPQIIGTNLVFSVDQVLRADTNGFWSTQMLQGDYKVTVSGKDTIYITVPDSTNTFNFIDLLTPELPSYIFRDPGKLVKVSVDDEEFGFLLEKATNGVNIVFTTLNPGTNEVLRIALSPSVALGDLTASTNVVLSYATVSRAAVIGSDNSLTNSPVTATELGYLSGVSAALQGQIDARAPTGSVTSASLTMATSKILGRATAGTGPIEELTPSGTGAPILATAPTIDGLSMTGLSTNKNYTLHYHSNGTTFAGYTGFGSGIFAGAATSSWGIRAAEKLHLSANASSTPMVTLDTAGNLIVVSGGMIVSTSQTPASAGATGTAGTIAWDANYIYVCIAANTWRRVAHATW